jgi:hypothetical protein
MAFLQAYLDGSGCGASSSPRKPNLPSHLIVVYGVTRLGGVGLWRAPQSMQTSKILQNRKNTIVEVIPASRTTNLKTSLARMALLLLSTVGSDLASGRLAAR